jgi:hypothetical protein
VAAGWTNDLRPLSRHEAPGRRPRCAGYAPKATSYAGLARCTGFTPTAWPASNAADPSLPQIPFHSWLGIFDPTAATQATYENRICSHAVSLVILRLSHKLYDHPYDSRVEGLLSRTGKYRLAITAGQGSYATQVWQLEPGSARGSCR